MMIRLIGARFWPPARAATIGPSPHAEPGAVGDGTKVLCRLAESPRRLLTMVGMAPFVLVALAYFAGSELGLVLRFPPATTSVLWPPNAILTATLLLTARRRWWMYLLAAFPAHVAAQVGTSWPTPLVLALFATNCSEALLAAAGVRAFSDGPARFDTLRRVGVFAVSGGPRAPLV